MTLNQVSRVTSQYQFFLPPKNKMPYYSVLDGWRGVSILMVLCTHMLPIGVNSWNLNKMTGRMGMSIFFALSGFLITTILIYRPNIKNFIIKRIFRVLPLAWTFLLISLPLVTSSTSKYWGHFFFYENLTSEAFTQLTGHYWSLCIEIQFYLFIALLYAIFKDKGLKLLLPLCLLSTAFSILLGEPASHVTFLRIDEIIVGCALALAKENRLGTDLPNLFSKINPLVPMVLLPLCCHPALTFLGYFRAYIAAILVGATIFQPTCWLSRLLRTKLLKYFAQVSYGLYVIHPITYYGWLGSGGDIVKYAKRPIAFVLTFTLAHLSTFHYEKYWQKVGANLISKPRTISIT